MPYSIMYFKKRYTHASIEVGNQTGKAQQPQLDCVKKYTPEIVTCEAHTGGSCVQYAAVHREHHTSYMDSHRHASTGCTQVERHSGRAFSVFLFSHAVRAMTAQTVVQTRILFAYNYIDLRIVRETQTQTKTQTTNKNTTKQPSTNTKQPTPKKNEIDAGETVKRCELAPLKASLRCSPQ